MKRGRKRKAGPRNPKNRRGRHVEVRVSPAQVAAGMPHRKGLKHPEDQRAESELGRMYLRGELTSEQHAAGEEFARLWRGYAGSIAGPKSLRTGAGGISDCGGCLGMVGTNFCACHQRKQKYLEALNLIEYPGLLDLVVIHDRPLPGPEYLAALQIDLGKLACHFGLTKRANRTSNNRSSHLTPIPPPEPS